MQFPTSYAVEGLAKIIVPIIKQSENVPLDRARSIAPVFFNEKMKMNRDTRK